MRYILKVSRKYICRARYVRYCLKHIRKSRASILVNLSGRTVRHLCAIAHFILILYAYGKHSTSRSNTDYANG